MIQHTLLGLQAAVNETPDGGCQLILSNPQTQEAWIIPLSPDARAAIGPAITGSGIIVAGANDIPDAPIPMNRAQRRNPKLN